MLGVCVCACVCTHTYVCAFKQPACDDFTFSSNFLVEFMKWCLENNIEYHNVFGGKWIKKFKFNEIII